MIDDFFYDQPDRSFAQYHRDNPHVYELFKKFTFEIINSGFQAIGAKFIVERIRWETYTSNKWENLKINNNYTAGYARLFMADHPQHSEFFRTRELKSKTNEGVGNG